MRKILEKLISFKTITEDKKENKKALVWIKNQVRNLPLFLREFEIRGFPSLILTTQKGKQPIIWFQAHLDVVPGPERVFQPKIRKGILYGRGAFDMKFAIACYLRLLKDLGENLSKYDFGIIITSDEEIGGFNGVKAILGKGFSSKVCFLPDGGKNWQFEKSAKGVFHLLIESKGKSGHGSRPWLAKNALDNLIDFLLALKKKFPQEPCKIKNHYHNTFSLGKIEGGEVANKIPNLAKALIDIRFISSKKSQIEKILNFTKRDFKNIKIKKIAFGDSIDIDINNPYLRLFSQIAREKFNIKTSFTISHGTSDARFFLKNKIPVILIRPKGGGHHSENEWIDLKDLEKFYFVLKEFVKTVAKNKFSKDRSHFQLPNLRPCQKDG